MITTSLLCDLELAPTLSALFTMFLLLITACLILYLLKLLTTNRNYWKKKNIIQTDNLLWKFMFDNRSMPEILKSIYDKYDATHIGAASGSINALILKDLNDIQAVFSGDFQSFYKRGIQTNPNDVLADNILFIGDFRKWKIIRQKLSPVFTSLKLKNMFYLLEKCARDFVKVIDTNNEMRENSFNVLYTYTTASIGASIFGIDTKSSNTMDSPFIEMSWKALKPSLKTNAITLISNMFPKLFGLFKLKFFGEHEDFFVGVVKNVLESRRREAVKGRHDFIEICLELQKNGSMNDISTGLDLEFSDELVAAQAFFFFIAGADTTANAIHFTLLELASNQKVLQRVHDEIDSLFGNGKEVLTYSDIEKLQYLDMVISEGMRKYPPIGSVQRRCTKDTVLPSGITIEKETAMIIPVYAIHRDEKYYPNPDKFDPERFRPENASNIKNCTYLPFGEGNRVCIGLRFARLQMKAAIAWLLRHYTLAEQNYSPKTFEKSPFALRDPEARYEYVKRNL